MRARIPIVSDWSILRRALPFGATTTTTTATTTTAAATAATAAAAATERFSATVGVRRGWLGTGSGVERALGLAHTTAVVAMLAAVSVVARAARTIAETPLAKVVVSWWW